MLKEINKEDAIRMLLDEYQADRVYFKNNNEYLRAGDYKFMFNHDKKSAVSGIDFLTTQFYEEISDVGLIYGINDIIFE